VTHPTITYPSSYLLSTSPQLTRPSRAIPSTWCRCSSSSYVRHRRHWLGLPSQKPPPLNKAPSSSPIPLQWVSRWAQGNMRYRGGSGSAESPKRLLAARWIRHLQAQEVRSVILITVSNLQFLRCIHHFDMLKTLWCFATVNTRWNVGTILDFWGNFLLDAVNAFVNSCKHCPPILHMSVDFFISEFCCDRWGFTATSGD
jgi:hypothetical protein